MLLLEDEPFIAMDLKDHLKSAGVKTVVVIDTTTKAEELLADHTPNIAIIYYRLGDGAAKAACSGSIPV